MKLKGAQILVKCLIRCGCTTIFGIPGNNVLDIYDALYENQDQIRHILTAHEQGACFAADGYARASGKTGVVLATSGPGATNLVTGIANSYMDSVPLLAITGNVPLSTLGRDGFQEVDITGITMPITKHNYIVNRPENIATTILSAFALTQSGRKGTVLVDIPKDILEQTIEYDESEQIQIDFAPKLHDNHLAFSQAISLLQTATKPLLLCGGGVSASGASEELKKLSGLLRAPVCCTLLGLDGYPATSPNYIGMVGQHGHTAAHKCIQACDLIIGIGTRFSDRITGNRHFSDKKILHIDIDYAEMDKNVQSTVNLVGDAKIILQQLLFALSQQTQNYGNEKQDTNTLQNLWKNEYTNYKNLEKFKNNLQNNVLLTVQRYIQDRITVTDVGLHQIMAARLLKFDTPRTFLSSGGLGAMGYGLGAAIGANLATNKGICLITGDGSLQMSLGELFTVIELQTNLVIVLFNNHKLGMVGDIQKKHYQGHEFAIEKNISYAKLAKALSIKTFTINRRDKIDKILETAFKENSPTLVEVNIP